MYLSRSCGSNCPTACWTIDPAAICNFATACCKIGCTFHRKPYRQRAVAAQAVSPKQWNEAGVYFRVMPKKKSPSRKSVKVVKRTKPVSKARTKAVVVMPKGYAELLAALKERIRAAQLRAALAVNHELVALF